MLSELKSTKCVQCEFNISKDDIIAVGIRKIPDSENCTLYIEYICSQCEYREIILNRKGRYSPNELCYILLEEMREKRNIERSMQNRSKPKGKMTNKEISEFLKFLEGTSSHEDFLKYIGFNSTGHDQTEPQDPPSKDNES